MELTECSSCFDTLFHDAPVTASLGLGVTLNWTIENQLASYYDGSTTTSFVYDGEGRKGKKTVGNTTTIYVNKYYEKTGSTVTTSYYLGDRLVAQREGTTLRYIHQDDLTGTALTTASNDSSTGSIRYHPYGSTRSGSVPTDRKFTGQRLDSTGLYYYGARYYDPVVGRFISPDTVVQDFANPQTLNRYSYVLNNPLRYVDPTGRAVEGYTHIDDIEAALALGILESSAQAAAEEFIGLAKEKPERATALFRSSINFRLTSERTDPSLGTRIINSIAVGGDAVSFAPHPIVAVVGYAVSSLAAVAGWTLTITSYFEGKADIADVGFNTATMVWGICDIKFGIIPSSLQFLYDEYNEEVKQAAMWWWMSR